MGQVANVALTDTFDTWRVRSNQSFTNLFEINPSANTVSANTVTGATLVATSAITVPAASISAVDVAFLANTNTFIGTKLDSSSYTTADVQAKAALANTNSRIGTVETATTTAAIQATAALANTNSRIAAVESATVSTAKLEDYAVTTVKIANLNVTTAKIADGAVTLTKAANAVKAYDFSFAMGYDADGAETDLAVQEYGWLLLPRDITFEDVLGYAETAPTGANLIFDIRINGTTIFSTLPEIDAGSNADDNNHVFSTTTASAGDRISFHVTQIGSTVAGSGLMVAVKARQT